MTVEFVDTLRKLRPEMSQIIVCTRVITARCLKDSILIKNVLRTLLYQEAKILTVKSVTTMKLLPSQTLQRTG